ncbi:MAG: hypothetical protein WC957_05035 [Candidatus Neomarinimicrobiota bacterium]
MVQYLLIPPKLGVVTQEHSNSGGRHATELTNQSPRLTGLAVRARGLSAGGGITTVEITLK